MPRRFRLETDRLVIRILDHRDVTEFVRYRNIADVAKYQDWPLPYTRDHAHELADELEHLTGPTSDEWVQLAIELDGKLIGDVAVWVDTVGTFAMIGYTLAPEHQGHGYATEAVAAVIDWLFRRRPIHRIAATLDPHNLASARVLERCGFEYVGTARGAAFVRGEWADDTRFSLLADDWKRWKKRPTRAPEVVELVEISDDNVHEVGELDRGFSQRDLVAPVLVSLAEALVPPTRRGELIQPWYRAITADGELVGFVMMAEPYGDHQHPYLWRMVIDLRHQRRGIGRRALEEIFRLRRATGYTGIRVSYVAGVAGSPEGFYRSLGFEPTGAVHGGEVEAVLDLTQPSS